MPGISAIDFVTFCDLVRSSSSTCPVGAVASGSIMRSAQSSTAGVTWVKSSLGNFRLGVIGSKIDDHIKLGHCEPAEFLRATAGPASLLAKQIAERAELLGRFRRR